MRPGQYAACRAFRNTPLAASERPDTDSRRSAITFEGFGTAYGRSAMTFASFRMGCTGLTLAFGSFGEGCTGYRTTSRSFRSRDKRSGRTFEGFGTAFEGFGKAFEGFGKAFEGFGTAFEGFGTAFEGFRKASVDAMVYSSAQGLAAYDGDKMREIRYRLNHADGCKASKVGDPGAGGTTGEPGAAGRSDGT
jgi:hypothetical protein